MTKKKKAKILEKFRKSTGGFNDEKSKESFLKVYKNLSEESLRELAKIQKKE